MGDDELVYAFPSDADLTCVALSLPVGGYPIVRRDPARAFAERLAAHPAIAPRYLAAEPAGRLFGCGPRPSVVRAPWGPGWSLVGDAAIYQDPWTGAGMDNASVHATFLAEALTAWLSGSVPEDEAMGRYVDTPRRARAGGVPRVRVVGPRSERPANVTSVTANTVIA